MQLFNINSIFQLVGNDEIYAMDEDTKSGVIPEAFREIDDWPPVNRNFRLFKIIIVVNRPGNSCCSRKGVIFHSNVYPAIFRLYSTGQTDFPSQQWLSFLYVARLHTR